MSSNRKQVLYEDDARIEYDFANPACGKYIERFPHDVVIVTRAPDIAAAFPNVEAVNDALRVLLKATKQFAPAARAAV